MNCLDVKELLSAFCDGELKQDAREQIQIHLRECSSCRKDLHELQQISDAAKRLEEPEPADLWRQIAVKLDRGAEAGANASPIRPVVRNRRRIIYGAAAAIFLAVGLTWMLQGNEDSHQMAAAHINQFVSNYQNHLEEAQRGLTEKYHGRYVTLEEAAKEVGYYPATAQKLPNDLTLKNICLLKMPCCLCVESIYQRPNNQLLVVFEHKEQDQDWFADRPCVQASCKGHTVSVIQCGAELAIIWKHRPDRYLTLLGARNLEEVASLVAHFAEDAKS